MIYINIIFKTVCGLLVCFWNWCGSLTGCCDPNCIPRKLFQSEQQKLMRKYGRYCVNNRRSSIIIENNLQVPVMVMVYIFALNLPPNTFNSSALLLVPVPARVPSQGGRPAYQTDSATHQVILLFSVLLWNPKCEPVELGREWTKEAIHRGIGEAPPPTLLLPGQFQRLPQGSRSGVTPAGIPFKRETYFSSSPQFKACRRSA